jgi:hypothetical protein
MYFCVESRTDTCTADDSKKDETDMDIRDQLINVEYVSTNSGGTLELKAS